MFGMPVLPSKSQTLAPTDARARTCIAARPKPHMVLLPRIGTPIQCDRHSPARGRTRPAAERTGSPFNLLHKTLAGRNKGRWLRVELCKDKPARQPALSDSRPAGPATQPAFGEKQFLGTPHGLQEQCGRPPAVGLAGLGFWPVQEGYATMIEFNIFF